jgi:pimeloyl-ACP methyl ester carboxylesterase
MNKRPKVWFENLQGYVHDSLRLEAVRRFAVNQVPVLEPAPWKEYAAELRNKIWSRLGTVYDGKLDLDYKEHGTIKMKGYSIRKVTYQSRPGVHVTATLYVPNGRGPFPAVINMHGHWAQGRLAARVQQCGHLLAMNGYVCLSVDAWGSGERSSVHGEYEYHGGNLGGSVMNLGETLMGAQVVDNMRGVDLLASLKYVNAKKIGATGASGGGNQTMWLAAMDERIKAAVPVVSVGSFESYVGRVNCVCELLPDGLTLTEESGVLALAAPRALKICNCLKDTNPTFYPAEMLRSYRPAEGVYRRLKADDCLSYQVFNLEHGYWPEIQEAMFGWFELHLKGKGLGMPKAFKALEVVPEDQMMIYEKGKRDKKIKTILEYCSERSGEFRKAMLKRSSFSEDRKRDELASVLRAEQPLEPMVHEYETQDGWHRLCIETTCGKMLPLLVKNVKNPSGYIIFAHPDGMNAVPDEPVEKALKEGCCVALVDLSGTGQTAGSMDSRMPFHELSRGFLWLGRTVIGEWARELDCVNSALRLWFDADRVSLYGYRETGIAALSCAALFGEVDGVTLNDAPLSYQFVARGIPDYFTMALHVPGFLKWGDLSLAAALAKCPVRYVKPVLSDGTAVCEIEYGVWQKEFNAMRKKCHIDAGGMEILSE